MAELVDADPRRSCWHRTPKRPGEIGLSRAKTAYLRDLAERLSDGRLDLERLQNLDDDYCEPIRAC